MTWRLALADDDATLRRLLRMLFERDGRFEVVGEAADGVEALDLLAAVEADVLLLDLAMPRKDGLEVLTELDRRPRPRVVVLTGFVEPALRRQVLDLGAHACLEKGADFASLTNAVAGVATA
ncbi:MAG TPA: response regulator transcription factor [Egicoccus sp.]|nr:response regulator transcription factor [Egicoccus sp.]HSK23616.1 response regulator transcription factor [Egicoccus sp.]